MRALRASPRRRASGRWAELVVFHVPEAILGVDEALREERVVDAPGPRVGDALGVSPDLDGAGEAREPQGARQIGKRRGEVASV